MLLVIPSSESILKILSILQYQYCNREYSVIIIGESKYTIYFFLILKMTLQKSSFEGDCACSITVFSEKLAFICLLICTVINTILSRENLFFVKILNYWHFITPWWHQFPVKCQKKRVEDSKTWSPGALAGDIMTDDVISSTWETHDVCLECQNICRL